MKLEELKRTIRQVPDFPKPGINFYDVATLFRDPHALHTAVERMVEHYRGKPIDLLAGIEARGLVLASALAYQLGLGLVLIRKAGKLPGKTETETYELEYGKEQVEIQSDAVGPDRRVVVIDDLLATGGTAAAAGRLVSRLGGHLAGYGFMVELGFLHGRKKLGGCDVFSLLSYD